MKTTSKNLTSLQKSLRKKTPTYKVQGKVAGHSVYHNNGYPRFSSGPNRGQYVHRVLKERQLGRKLKTSEEVDHKTGKREEYNPQKTKVMSKQDHAKKTNRTRKQKGYSGDKRYFHSREYLQKNEIQGGIRDDASVHMFDPIQVAKGMLVEMEHTNDPKIALEICLDHLTEDKKYYDKLEVMEGKAKKGMSKSLKKVLNVFKNCGKKH